MKAQQPAPILRGADRAAAKLAATKQAANQTPITTQQTPATGGPAIGTNTAAPAGDLASLQAQRKKIINEIHRRGGQGKAPGFAKQLQDVTSQIRGLRAGGQNPSIPTPPPAAPEDPAASIPPNPENPPASDEAMNALYPGLNYQLPENYEGSPMYKWQMERGNKMLDRRLAARGLLGSGAELEAANQLAAQVGAQESDRLRGDMQTEADRYERVSANEANRRTQAGDTQWRRLMDLMDFSTRNSPMDAAYRGLEGFQGLFGDQSKERSGNRANNYQRVTAPGGRAIAPFLPPGSSSPNYTQADLAALMLGNSNNRNTGSFLDSIIGSIGPIMKGFGF
jgi:hypothetical protein